MIYLIQHKLTKKYSKGGVPCRAWTDKIEDAKTWKKAAHVKSHITSIKHYRRNWGREQYGNPDEWIVIEAEVTPKNTYEASTFS